MNTLTTVTLQTLERRLNDIEALVNSPAFELLVKQIEEDIKNATAIALDVSKTSAERDAACGAVAALKAILSWPADQTTTLRRKIEEERKKLHFSQVAR